MGGMYYSDDTLKKIKERGDIVEIISQYVPLKKKGSVFMGGCPFHKEKTPSFVVSRESQSYCCQGCGASGNALTFLRKINDYTFHEALQVLATEEGVSLPEPIPFEQTPAGNWKKRILELNKDAAIYFYETLHHKPSGKRGMEYLTERDITKETMHKFGLGYAPYGGKEVLKHLRNLGYTEEELLESGLARVHEQYGLQCVFRNRVIYPIFDSNQRVVGFGGRALWANPRSKYLNSRDTESFSKKMMLYGFNYAKRVPGRTIILCEGFMDVISMHQAGFGCAAASLGTALTPEQTKLVGRYFDHVYLAYDGDEAGRKAALRAIEMFDEMKNLEVKVIDLSPCKDPDEFIKTYGRNAYLERMKLARKKEEFLKLYLESEEEKETIFEEKKDIKEQNEEINETYEEYEK